MYNINMRMDISHTHNKEEYHVRSQWRFYLFFFRLSSLIPLKKGKREYPVPSSTVCFAHQIIKFYREREFSGNHCLFTFQSKEYVLSAKEYFQVQLASVYISDYLALLSDKAAPLSRLKLCSP